MLNGLRWIRPIAADCRVLDSVSRIIQSERVDTVSECVKHVHVKKGIFRFSCLKLNLTFILIRNAL